MLSAAITLLSLETKLSELSLRYTLYFTYTIYVWYITYIIHGILGSTRNPHLGIWSIGTLVWRAADYSRHCIGQQTTACHIDKRNQETIASSQDCQRYTTFVSLWHKCDLLAAVKLGTSDSAWFVLGWDRRETIRVYIHKVWGLI